MEQHEPDGVLLNKACVTARRVHSRLSRSSVSQEKPGAIAPSVDEAIEQLERLIGELQKEHLDP